MQRLITCVALLHQGIAALNEAHAGGVMAPAASGAVLGLFLLAGLWTPVVGTLVAAVEVWMVLTVGGDVWLSVLVAVLGASLAMIGPGAWSIDARLFGRKRLTN